MLTVMFPGAPRIVLSPVVRWGKALPPSSVTATMPGLLRLLNSRNLIGNDREPLTYTWWTFRIYIYFFCSGRRKGEFEGPGGGGDPFLMENPRRGGVTRTGGAEGPGGYRR